MNVPELVASRSVFSVNEGDQNRIQNLIETFARVFRQEAQYKTHFPILKAA